MTRITPTCILTTKTRLSTGQAYTAPMATGCHRACSMDTAWASAQDGDMAILTVHPAGVMIHFITAVAWVMVVTMAGVLAMGLAIHITAVIITVITTGIIM